MTFNGAENCLKTGKDFPVGFVSIVYVLMGDLCVVRMRTCMKAIWPDLLHCAKEEHIPQLTLCNIC